MRNIKNMCTGKTNLLHYTVLVLVCWPYDHSICSLMWLFLAPLSMPKAIKVILWLEYNELIQHLLCIHTHCSSLIWSIVSSCLSLLPASSVLIQSNQIKSQSQARSWSHSAVQLSMKESIYFSVHICPSDQLTLEVVVYRKSGNMLTSVRAREP
jgi:hypothetical protein